MSVFAFHSLCVNKMQRGSVSLSQTTTHTSDDEPPLIHVFVLTCSLNLLFLLGLFNSLCRSFVVVVVVAAAFWLALWQPSFYVPML